MTIENKFWAFFITNSATIKKINATLKIKNVLHFTNNRFNMQLLCLIIVVVLSSIPWYSAFKKFEIQASGRSIFIKNLRKWFLMALFWFGLFLLLALNNSIPTKNTTGSYSAGEIREAVYLFIGTLIVIITYIASGMHCHQMAKERYLLLNPPKKKQVRG